MIRAAEILESGDHGVAELLYERKWARPSPPPRVKSRSARSTMRYYAEHAEAMLRDEAVSTSGSRSGIRYDPIAPFWQ